MKHKITYKDEKDKIRESFQDEKVERTMGAIIADKMQMGFVIKHFNITIWYPSSRIISVEFPVGME